MSIVHKKRKAISGQSLEITSTYVQRGQAISRSLWVRASPRHPLLKVIMTPPTAILMLTMLVLFLIVRGFILLAVALMRAISGAGEKDSQGA
jgi:hypothetical protein